MDTYIAKCDICGTENTVASYGDWQCRQCGQGYTYDECHQIRLTDAQLALLRSPLRWIRVDERLPEENVSVLVNHWITGIEMAFRRDGQWGITWTGFMGSGVGYTHWMPLPEPPCTRGGDGVKG